MRRSALVELARTNENVAVENGGLYFRVVRDGGRWVYRRGRRVISRHGSLDEALEQARRDAAAHRPSQVIVHSEDGEVMFVEPFD